MSKTEKTYCSLYTFIKRTNPDLYDVLDDMCAVGLFRTRNDITFLNPSEKLTKQLVDMIEKDNAEGAYNKLKSLFIYGKHSKLNKDVISYNNKKYSDNLSELNQLSEFKQWKDSQNVSVFDYKSDKFPTEGEDAERPIMNRSKGKGKKGGEISKKITFTHELMETKDYKKVIYALNSLLKSLDNNKLEKIKSIIDPNMILSWYIIVQPGKANDTHISNEDFNNWANANTIDNMAENTDVLRDILENIKASKQTLMETKQKRENAKEIMELSNIQEHLQNIYDNNKTKLLEDELRFRYSDESNESMFDNYICALTMIDWNNPSDSLVLLKNINNMNNNAVLHCLQKFIHSSAFNYTLLSNDMCDKLKESISGAGSKKGKKMVKVLGNKHREMLSNTKSVNTIDIVESLLNHLSKKERTHLKSLL